MDWIEVCEFLEKQDKEGLIVVLEQVVKWPVHATQNDSTTRHFGAIEMIEKLQSEQVIPEQARKFLKGCAIAKPARAERW